VSPCFFGGQLLTGFKDVFSANPDSPTPARYRTRNTPAQTQPITFAIPETPKRTNNYYKSPLPASSPPPQSSPFSSPTKRVVNLVSSPGPMGPPPSESDYDNLPYTLPLGPYSSKKPDLSYAALVGRAILSSPKHALTLQEIYDWITIVYPHFKRGETTWMNSIRHVLSTTACFRKHTRERSVGRTLWAIWDCDLECFKNGGFRKQYCKDLVDSRKAAAIDRKRSADESGERKPKRQRKSAAAATEKEAAEALSAANLQPTLPPLVPASQLNPLFPGTRPTPHHQSYYESCVQQQDAMSAEVIFPPLPPSNYQRMTSGASTSSGSTSYSHFSFISEASSSATTYDSEPPSNSPPAPSSSASASMPALTPNGSSSSPLLPSEDNMDDAGRESPDLVYPDDADDKLFSEMLSAEALEPGFTLSKHDYYESINKGKRKPVTPAKVFYTAFCILGTGLTCFISEICPITSRGSFAYTKSQIQCEGDQNRDTVTIEGVPSSIVPANDYAPFTTDNSSTKCSRCAIPAAITCSHPSIPQRAPYEPLRQSGALQITSGPTSASCFIVLPLLWHRY